MSEVKEVTVKLTEADAKALTGKKPRRTRSSRRVGGGAETGAQDIGGAVSPSEAAVAESSARITKVEGPPTGVEARLSGSSSLSSAPLVGGGTTSEPVSPLATGLSITPPATVMPKLSPTTAVGGGSVTIGGKKSGGAAKTSTVNTVPTVGGAAKIVPTKRRPTAAPPAQTLKKPKFRVEGGGESPVGGTPSTRVPGAEKFGGGSQSASGSFKQTRRFKERKIRLTVKSSRASRKVRKGVKARVRAMSLADIRAFLLKKNIIKASAADKLPEEMLRNMIRDYLLLHSVE